MSIEDILSDSHTAAFHIKLLAKVIDMEQYPFIKLLIEQNISQKEYEELLELLQGLENMYETQREEGLLDFTSLLVKFAGKLNEKLDPNQTIYALKKEGYFPSLLTEFTKLIERNSIYSSRRRQRDK